MSNSKLYRMGGYALLLGGLLILIKKTVIELLLPYSLVTYSAGPFAAVLGLFGLTAVYLYQREESGRLGEIGYLINWFGLALACCIEYLKNFIFPFLDKGTLQMLLAGPIRLVLLSTSFLFLAGVIVFGIAMLRTGMFPRLAVVLYIIGFIPYGFGPLLPDIVTRTGTIIAAVSIIWLGYSLFTASKRAVTLKVSPSMGA